MAKHGTEVSEVTVSRFVALRRRELGLSRVEVFVPQDHLFGAGSEVDFGEFRIRLRGQDLEVWMFVTRVSACGKAFHHRFANQAREAFWMGTCARWSISAAFRPGSGTTISSPQWCGSSRAVAGSRTTGSPRCAHTTGLELFFCSPGQGRGA